MSKKKQKLCFDVELCDNAIFDSLPVIRSKQKSELTNTPMKNQYEDIKRYYPDDIVLFQRGNFFQAYNEDAHFIRKYIDVQWKVPDQLIGLSEVSVLEHVQTLIMQTDRKIVFCEQSTFQKTSNSLLDRFVTGIYSRGLLGFGILGENINNIEQNYLVSLYKNEAIVIDTINKVGYHTQSENLQRIKITEIITNEKYKGNCLKNSAKGRNAFEQLENFFKERQIDGLSQISFVDSLSPFHRFCSISDNTLNQLLFKPLITPITKEGQRKLQQMMKRIPLDNIIDRQNIIKDFRNHTEFRESFISELKRIGSLQHQMARVFNAPKNKLILKNFLQNIKYLLMQLKQKIYANKQNYKSNYLSNLEEYNYNFIQIIQDKFLWEGENQDEIVPNNESRNEYNQIMDSLENINDQSLAEYQQIKQFYKGQENQLTFKNFEIEMPEEFKVPHNLQFSNQRKGYRKYTTTTLQRLQQSQIQLLDQLKKFLFLFYNQIINDIIEQREGFQTIINQMSELDVYMAMSKYLEHNQQKCRPQISDQFGLLFEEFQHPLIENCIPNSIEINKCIIITGYNGAGKSTILRSIGLIVVLATLGCDVPCKQMIFQPFNEIHTRMGAYDSIRESTFQIELQEVKNMIDKQNSLLLIDELGRGTSSIDGHSLAYAILKYLLKQQSIILFTTHFNIQLNQDIYFMEDYKLQKGQILEGLTSKIMND